MRERCTEAASTFPTCTQGPQRGAWTQISEAQPSVSRTKHQFVRSVSFPQADIEQCQLAPQGLISPAVLCRGASTDGDSSPSLTFKLRSSVPGNRGQTGAASCFSGWQQPGGSFASVGTWKRRIS